MAVSRDEIERLGLDDFERERLGVTLAAKDPSDGK